MELTFDHTSGRVRQLYGTLTCVEPGKFLLRLDSEADPSFWLQVPLSQSDLDEAQAELSKLEAYEETQALLDEHRRARG
jgi:hypothetical protein